MRARLAQPTALAIAGDTVSLDAVQLDVGGGRISATGSAGAKLDIALDVQALPLSIANAIAPDLGLAGTLNGSGRITGSASDPAASFSISGSGVSAAAISEFGITPMQFSGRGSFAKQTLVLESASAQGAGGLQLTANGPGAAQWARSRRRGAGIGAAGAWQPVRCRSRRPAQRHRQPQCPCYRQPQLAAVRGYGLDQRFGLYRSGAEPQTGRYYRPRQPRRQPHQYRQPDRRPCYRWLAVGRRLGWAWRRQSGRYRGCGSTSARYADGNMFVATVSGDLALRGRLDASPTLSGNVMIEKADITIPDSLGAAGTIIDAKHINASKPVLVTLKRAAVTASGAPMPQRRLLGGAARHHRQRAQPDLHPRTRVDAEVGGSVRLTGSVNDIRPVGGFELNRGRLAILGQRVTFEEGSAGHWSAISTCSSISPRAPKATASRCSSMSPAVSRSSISASAPTPQLPEDEVLSRLLFKRSMGELTPIQLAKLPAPPRNWRAAAVVRWSTRCELSCRPRRSRRGHQRGW